MLEKNKRRIKSLEYDVECLKEKREVAEARVEGIWEVLCNVAEMSGCRIKVEAARPKRWVVTKKGGEESREHVSSAKEVT